MTRTDTIKLIAVIKTAYPEFHKDGGEAETVALWHKMLEPYPKEMCNAAVLKHIQECKFAPKISEILEQIKRKNKHGQPTLEGIKRMIHLRVQMHEGEILPDKLIAECKQYGVAIPALPGRSPA